ncbi:MAG TPA: sugar transferase [Anaerolineales bacterium]|nr:sugar transferase [Anaerolineales bacterium]
MWRLRPNERRALLLIGDFAIAWAALAGAVYIWAIAMVQERPLLEFIRLRMETWFFLLPVVWLILLIDSYDQRTSTDLNRTLRSVSTSALVGSGIYLVIYFASDASLPRRGVAAFLGIVYLLTLLWRLIYIRIFSAPQFMHSVMLVGAGETGSAILQVLDQIQAPFNLVGLIDDAPEKQGELIHGFRVMGTGDQLLVLAEANNISEIIVAISGKMLPETFQTLLEAQERGIQITRMPVSYEELLERVPVQYLEADWILRSFVDEARVSSFYSGFKRLIDIIGGLVGVLSLVVIAPLISLGILIESGRPIVFTQTRAGRGGLPFRIYKFRTMHVSDNDNEMEMTKEDDIRVTPFGRILRKTHLDEWLQFFNVLRGDMSLVGPRPELPRLVDHFQSHIPFYRARLLVKPGIAGWAQIHLNYAANIDETRIKLEYDLYYIKHRNLWMDITILLRTFASVIGFRGR